MGPLYWLPNIHYLVDTETTNYQLNYSSLLPLRFSFLSLRLDLTCPLRAPADVGRCRSLAPASSWCWGAGRGAGAVSPARSSPAPARSPARRSPGKGPAAGWSTAAGCSAGSSPGLSPKNKPRGAFGLMIAQSPWNVIKRVESGYVKTWHSLIVLRKKRIIPRHKQRQFCVFMLHCELFEFL